MIGEYTKGELISAFKGACSHSGEVGAEFIFEHIFKNSQKRSETINQEVDRKFQALNEFAVKVIAGYGMGATFKITRPRDYMDQLVALDDPKTKTLRSNIYHAFYLAGHHIRELTDKPEYIIPESAMRLEAAAQ